MSCGTPLTIEVLIHCHAYPRPHPRAGAPAVAEAINHLEDQGLIEKAYASPDFRVIHRTTEKGKAHLHQLCKLPFPKQAWVGRDGKIIGEDNP